MGQELFIKLWVESCLLLMALTRKSFGVQMKIESGLMQRIMTLWSVPNGKTIQRMMEFSGASTGYFVGTTMSTTLFLVEITWMTSN
ncbi:U5 putative protein [Bimbo virus]|uniref:Uncharacterized protein n=1 Tax=Bimbo virus TaxID=864694 RepID=A0AAE8XBM3_9RHAB|nr:U5 putative protein [Bimbo virus]UAU42875.1 U5 putative protein [Bimbo virus]